MITTKTELKQYLLMDAIALFNGDRKRPKLFGDEIWKFQILLRKTEYYSSTKKNNKFHILPYCWYLFRYKKRQLKLGFSIPVNVFGPGLSIAHYGCIAVNPNARVGKNCRIHEGVTIGATSGSGEAAVIGDNVFIGTGAKVIGKISIANDVAIGANAVVVKDILEEGVTYAGVPAKKISDNNSHSNLAPDIFK